jgi:5,5'-dehydrodivanillate O-demethylase oxygenase subunit
MDQTERRHERAGQMKLLTQTARGTPMGTLLRQFWQPFALVRQVVSGKAQPIRLLSEDLTLFRGDSGAHYLVGGRCAHRGTLLYPGWVEGETIRCVYHGWRFDGTGRCVERPAEKDAGNALCRIPGYPVREYAGLWRGGRI